jgi:transposase
MSDATSLLFGLEDEFCVLEVQRIGSSGLRLVMEQTAREGPCPACGVFTGRVKDRPLVRLKDLPVSGQSVELWWRKRRLVCVESLCLPKTLPRWPASPP